MKAIHRSEIRELGKNQKLNKEKRHKVWRALCQNADSSYNLESQADSKVGSLSQSSAVSGASSMQHSRQGSALELRTKSKMEEQELDALNTSASVVYTQVGDAKNALIKLQAGLVELKKKNEKEFYALKQAHEIAFKELKGKFDSDLVELELAHEVDKKRLGADGAADIEEALSNQEKEIEMEGVIRQAETNALIERKGKLTC